MTASPLTLDRLCIHQVTLMQCDFRASIECLSRNGVTMTAVWRDKLDEIGTAEAKRILTGNGVEAVSLCAGGLVTESGAAARQDILDDNRRWIDQAAAIGATSMVAITGGLPDGDRDLAAARARALDGLAQIVPHARAAGVRLALEPLHPMVCGYRSVISTVGEATAMLDQLAADDVMGLAIDSYALWWEPDLDQKLVDAAPRILNFHVSDWLKDTRDVRLDRGMPGDGVIDNRHIRGVIEATGFSGPAEVEIFSERTWWKLLPDDVVSTIIQRMPMHL